MPLLKTKQCPQLQNRSKKIDSLHKAIVQHSADSQWQDPYKALSSILTGNEKTEVETETATAKIRTFGEFPSTIDRR